MHLDYRFDVLIKGSCLNKFEADNEVWGKPTQAMYKQHLEIITSGTFREKKGKKTGLEDYLRAFSMLHKDFKNSNVKPTVLEVDNRGTIIDGAHRLTCAIRYGKKLRFKIEKNSGLIDYSFDFFESSGYKFNGEVIEYTMSRYPEARLAILWPSTNHISKIESLLPQRLIKTILPSNKVMAHNVVVNAYSGEIWLGNEKNKYIGAWDKVESCFTTRDHVRIILFNSKGHDSNILKNEIRKLAKVGNHSIHITDTWQETFEKANIFFASDIKNWGNFTSLNTSQRFLAKLDNLKHYLLSKKINYEKSLLVKGVCMELFNLRAADDIDIFVTSQTNIGKPKNQFVEEEEVEDLAIAEGYFYFQGLRFWTFKKLLSNRLASKGEKYEIDKKLILNGHKNIMFLSKLRVNSRRLTNKLKRKCLNFLSDVGLYYYVRSVWRLFK